MFKICINREKAVRVEAKAEKKTEKMLAIRHSLAG